MSWDLVIWICAAMCSGFAHSLPAQSVATRPVYLTALLGSKPCTFGPSYWCTNFTTSSQCYADNYCIRNVWEHTVPLPDNGRICKTCIKMVEHAREQLHSNKKQENIKLVLEGSCLILIPTKPLALECVKLIDQAIPQLIKALSSQMNPQMVCAATGLCNSFRLDNMMAMYKPLTPLLSVEIVNTLQYDQSSSVHKAPSYKPNGLHRVPLISSGLFMNEIPSAKKDKEVDNEICDLCESVLNTLQKALQNNEIQAVIHEVIEQVCLIYRLPNRPQCKQTIDLYFDFIMNTVAKLINPNQMCQFLSFCPWTGVNRQFIEENQVLPEKCLVG